MVEPSVKTGVAIWDLMMGPVPGSKPTDDELYRYWSWGGMRECV